MTEQLTALLREGVGRLGLEDEAAFSRLERYIGELERWNDRLGFVHAEGRDLVVRHILDSLAGLPVIIPRCAGQAARIADVGSGGGLPGMPLACYLPGARMTLVERSERKCGFLRGAALAAGLRNTDVESADYANLDRQFDIIVFRAFQPLSSELLVRLTRLLAPGGAVCAYKGRLEKIHAEHDSLGDSLAGFRTEIVALSVPFLDEERNLVVIERAGGS